MINLEVQFYCQNCPDFEPEVEQEQFYDYINTIIRCKHRIRCKTIYDYITKQKEKS